MQKICFACELFNRFSRKLSLNWLSYALCGWIANSDKIWTLSDCDITPFENSTSHWSFRTLLPMVITFDKQNVYRKHYSNSLSLTLDEIWDGCVCHLEYRLNTLTFELFNRFLRNLSEAMTFCKPLDNWSHDKKINYWNEIIWCEEFRLFLKSVKEEQNIV
jgi:hypothetical protein